MFWILAIIYISIDVYSLSNIDILGYYRSGALAQLQISVSCMCGMLASINTTSKRKAVMIIMFFGSSLIFFTTYIAGNQYEWVYWIEITLWVVGVIWAVARPYEFISDQISNGTVCILFYKANSGSWLMHVLSLIGLPVSSMSIVSGTYWLKLVMNNPNLEVHLSDSVDLHRYIVVDTGVKITEDVNEAFWELDGEPAVNMKSLWLRVRCIAAVKPLLLKLGPEWYPRNIFQQIPSLYFYKALWNRQHRKA